MSSPLGRLGGKSKTTILAKIKQIAYLSTKATKLHWKSRLMNRKLKAQQDTATIASLDSDHGDILNLSKFWVAVILELLTQLWQ